MKKFVWLILGCCLFIGCNSVKFKDDELLWYDCYYGTYKKYKLSEQVIDLTMGNEIDSSIEIYTSFSLPKNCNDYFKISLRNTVQKDNQKDRWVPNKEIETRIIDLFPVKHYTINLSLQSLLFEFLKDESSTENVNEVYISIFNWGFSFPFKEMRNKTYKFYLTNKGFEKFTRYVNGNAKTSYYKIIDYEKPILYNSQSQTFKYEKMFKEAEVK